MSRGYLLVRADGKSYGLPVARVLEVGDMGQVMDVPRALPVLVHLGALFVLWLFCYALYRQRFFFKL